MKTKLDDKTGKPQDYDSLFRSYAPLVASCAARVKVPYQDIADAMQEVQLKFWRKGGLELFDEEQEKRFATFYRAWTQKFLLQERDKSFRYGSRNDLCGECDESSDVVEFETSFTDAAYIDDWIKRGEDVLSKSKYPKLARLFRLCVETAEATGKKPLQRDMARVLGCSVASTPRMMGKMISILTEAGLGVESLYDTK